MKLFSLKVSKLAFALLFIFAGSTISLPVHAAPKKAQGANQKKKAKAQKNKKQAKDKKAAPGPKRGGKKETAKAKDDAHTKKAQALFNQFVDIENKISWQCFSKKLAAALAVDAKYKPLVAELKSLESERNALKIAKRLMQHKELLTPEIRSLLSSQSSTDLHGILKQRISFNDKNQC